MSYRIDVIDRDNNLLHDALDPIRLTPCPTITLLATLDVFSYEIRLYQLLRFNVSFRFYNNYTNSPARFNNAHAHIITVSMLAATISILFAWSRGVTITTPRTYAYSCEK